MSHKENYLETALSAEPLIAIRYWGVRDLEDEDIALVSAINRSPWPAKQPFKAACSSWCKLAHGREKKARPIPHTSGMCSIYAARHPSDRGSRHELLGDGQSMFGSKPRERQ